MADITREITKAGSYTLNIGLSQSCGSESISFVKDGDGTGGIDINPPSGTGPFTVNVTAQEENINAVIYPVIKGETCRNAKVIVRVDGTGPACPCNNLKITGSTISGDASGNVTIATYNSNTCVRITSVSVKEGSWITNAGDAGNGTITGTVTPNTSTQSQRTAKINVVGATDTESCPASVYGDITIKQDPKPETCPDNCNSITSWNISPTLLPEGSGEEYVEIGSYTLNSLCTTNKVSFSSDKSDVDVRSALGNKIEAKYGAATSERTVVVTIKWDGSNCTTKSASQGANCGCDDFNLTTNPCSWETGSTEPTQRYYTKGSCITYVHPYVTGSTQSEINHFTVKLTSTTQGDCVEIQPTSINQNEDAINASVVVEYGLSQTDKCGQKTISLTHKGTQCGCDVSLNTDNCDWSAGQTSPQRRYYTIGDCITVGEIYESPEHLEDMGHFSAQTFTDSSGDYLAIWPAIANTRTTPYNSTLHVKFLRYGTECVDKTITLTHNPCTCDVTLDTTLCDWPAGQTDVKHRYYTTSDCVTIGEIYESPEHLEDMGHFSAQTFTDSYGDYVGIWPAIANTRTTPYNSTLHVKFLRYGTECVDKTITLKHEGIELDCDCSDLVVITSDGDEIAWEDTVIMVEPDESYRLTYKFKDGKSECFNGSQITFDYDNQDELFIVTTGTSQGKSYIDVRPNPDNGESGDILIEFKYGLEDGTNCGSWSNNYITVSFNPACTCENLLPENACVLRSVPTAAGTYYLGTFESIGCGSFSGSSTSSQVEKVILDEVGGDYRVSAKLKNFTPTSSQPDAPIDIDIYFYEGGASHKECHAVYRIRQMENYLNCDRINHVTFVNDNPSYSQSDTAFIAKLSDSEGIIALNAMRDDNIITSFETQYNWIDASSLYFYPLGSSIYIRGHIDRNESSEPRTNTITINFDKNLLKSIYGICGDCVDHPFTFSVTQRGDSSYSCECPEDEEIKIVYFGAETSYNLPRVLNSCFVDGQMKFIPKDFPTPQDFYDDYVAVNSWLSIKLEVKTDASAPDKSYLNIAYKALGNTEYQERTYVFKIKVNFDTTKQPEECVQEITFKQDPLIDVTCEQLLDSIKVTSLNLLATNTRSTIAWFSPVLMEGIRISGETVANCGDCDDCSWITSFSPVGTSLYLDYTQNKSTMYDHSSNPRCATINLFLVDSEGERLKIDGSECGMLENIVLTQDGYSGDCKACAEVIDSLPAPNFVPYRNGVYSERGVDYSAFNEGDGQTERGLFEFLIPYDMYYDSNRCFDLVADTTHHDSFKQYSDGQYLHVDVSNGKWIVKGVLLPATEPIHSVAVEVYIKRRSLISGESTQCGGTSYITDFVVLQNQQ